MGWKTGFEPATPGITIRCSNQLSYIHHKSCETSTVRFVRSRPSRAPVTRLRAGRIFIVRIGAPGRNRTCNHRLRRPVLYPVELRARGAHDSQTDRSEHAAAGSARCGPKLVGVEGFEPPTSCSQSRRATRLRYTPTDAARRYRRAGCRALSGGPRSLSTRGAGGWRLIPPKYPVPSPGPGSARGPAKPDNQRPRRLPRWQEWVCKFQSRPSATSGAG
jgi:hypothetical protein